MKKEINLILGKRKNNTLNKRVLLGASIAFSIVVVISIAILAYRLFLTNQATSLGNQEETLVAQLNAVRDRRDKFIIIKERLKEAQRIISRRLNITSKFDDAQQVLPTNATLETFTGTDEEVELRVESESLDALGQLINEKIITLASDKKKGIKKIEMKSFLLNPITKMYSVIFGVTYQ